MPRTLIALAFLLALAAPAAAQATIVDQVKAELVARGVPLTGPCGAFAITSRVAWVLRAEGVGLFGGKSPAQNGCTVGTERYAVDVVVTRSGQAVDILINSENENRPAWQVLGLTAGAPWRAPFNPDGSAPPPPPEPIVDVPPPPPSGELALVLALLQALEARLLLLEARPFPNYVGAGTIPYLGPVTFTLKPQPQ
jgi:hypothetical protein